VQGTRQPDVVPVITINFNANGDRLQDRANDDLDGKAKKSQRWALEIPIFLSTQGDETRVIGAWTTPACRRRIGRSVANLREDLG